MTATGIGTEDALTVDQQPQIVNDGVRGLGVETEVRNPRNGSAAAAGSASPREIVVEIETGIEIARGMMMHDALMLLCISYKFYLIFYIS